MPKLNDPHPGECARSAAVESNRASPLFTIVIPALNEENVIGRCLDSIAHLEFPSSNFEVIVVDNGSSDQTREIANSYREAVRLTVLLQPKVNISALRNAGASASSGKFLIFLDADMIVPKDWLQRAEALFISSKADILGGSFDVPKNSSWVARVWFGRKTKVVTLSPSYVPSGNLMVRRSHFDSIGGFDERLRTSEDCDFCFRAGAMGLTMAIYDDISVIHLGSPQTLMAFFRREMWHGSSVFRVFLLHSRSFQNGRPVLFATYTLLCLAMIAAAAVISIFGGHLSLILPSIAMLLLAPLVLAMRNARGRGWRDFHLMFILFLVYGISRAISLLGYQNLHSRRGNPADSLQAVRSR